MRVVNTVFLVILVFVFIILDFARPTQALAATVNLGTAGGFAVLAGSGITNSTGPTTITGDVGSSPTPTETGFETVTITGTNHNDPDPNDAATQGAKTALNAAYTDAAGRAALPDIGTDLAGQTLTAGVYHAASGTFSITGGGTLTLDGGGDPNAVFIFKMGTTLVTSDSSKVVLTNSAQPCHVFWQVGTSATLGSSTTFVGTIMADQSITTAGGGVVTGRFLAKVAHVTLSNTAITNSLCAPVLGLRKAITNDNGGTAANTEWILRATGTGGSPTNLSGTTPVDSDTTFKADTYTLTEESGPAGYAASSWVCEGGSQVGSTITLVAAESATCTITNNDIPPQLHLRKIINGGTATAADFTLTANGSGSNDLSGTSPVDSGSGLLADTFALSETNPGGYLASAWVCVGGTQSGSNITVGINQSATCTITNTSIDVAPQLTVTKTVTNDNGGTKVVANFFLFIDGSGVTSEVANTVSTGQHTVSETPDSGYTSTIGGDCAVGGTVTLAAGESKTCTINNNDIAPTLKLVKVVNNLYGGNSSPSAWTLSAGGTGGFSDAGNSSTFHTVKANEAHALSESTVSGYTAGTWSCNGGSLVGGSVTLGLAENVTCTITNSDQPAHLIVIKQVDNGTTGATAVASDFTTTITSVTTATPTALGAVSPGVNNTLTSVGSYSVDEGAHVGYSKSLSADCTGSIALGETKTCTITNTAIAPTLTVTKTVTNDNGGTKVVANFSLFVDGGSVTSTVVNTVSIGSHTVSETPDSGYTSTIGGDCATDGTLTLALDEDKTCTITNNDIPATLHIIKTVNNNHGGTAGASHFKLHLKLSGSDADVSGSPASGVATPGRSYTLNPGIYDVSEDSYGGYSGTFSGDCNSRGSVTLSAGEEKTCTLTNDDIPLAIGGGITLSPKLPNSGFPILDK